MCNPVAIAMAVVTIASTGVQQIQAKNTAEDQMESANDALILDQEALAAQQGEENDAIRLQQFERQRQGMKEQSALAVALGEANMTGNTPMMELSDVIAQTDYDMSIMESNREKTIAQGGRSQQKVFSTANGRINEAQNSAGNLLSNSLAIGSAGLSGYSQGMALGNGIQGMRSAPKTIKAGTYKVKK